MPSKKPQILIRTTEENKKKIEAIAEEQKRSVSNLMEIIIEEYLRKYEATNELTKKQKDISKLIDMNSISEWKGEEKCSQERKEKNSWQT